MFTLPLNARILADFPHYFVKNPWNTLSISADQRFTVGIMRTLSAKNSSTYGNVNKLCNSPNLTKRIYCGRRADGEFMVKRKTFAKRLGLKLIAAAVILLGVFLFTEISFRPMIEEVNSYQCHKAVSRIINDAVLSELDRIGADYSSLVTLSENGSGEVTSVQSNIVNINRLKTNIAERVESEIEQMSNLDIQIPIGTLIGLQLFHGKGFNVGMSVLPVGYAETTIISEFSEAGLNQTLHRIIVEISADVDALIPGFKTRVPVKTSIVAAETVIVGRVPDAYTHVITESGELAGTLNDYGAVVD